MSLIKLHNSKQIHKPKVKIFKNQLGIYTYCVECQDSFKPTQHPRMFRQFFYVMAGLPSEMIRSLEQYMMMKGITN